MAQARSTRTSSDSAPAAYSLHRPFAIDDAAQLLGKTADITYQPDPDRDRTETQPATQVSAVYERRAGTGYLEVTCTRAVGGIPADSPMIIPFGDVREVANAREA